MQETPVDDGNYVDCRVTGRKYQRQTGLSAICENRLRPLYQELV